jgi:hypothetical protein
MHEAEIRARIRQLHETGQVPCADGEAKLWAGRGRGELCALCIEPIASIETEFEIDLTSGITLRVHRRCYQLWLEECESILASQP